MAEYKFVDLLSEYIKEKVEKLINDYRNSLPQELADLPNERIIFLITDRATLILRKIEDDAIDAGIERAAYLIRYSRRVSK